LSSWEPVAYTMNELNRSMGLGDAYPFDLPQAVRGKLHFVHMVMLDFRHRAGKPHRQRAPAAKVSNGARSDDAFTRSEPAPATKDL